MEQFTETTLIGTQSAMIDQKQIPHEHDTHMANQRIVITALDFLSQTQVLFDHLEEHFDVPTFSVDADYILIR